MKLTLPFMILCCGSSVLADDCDADCQHDKGHGVEIAKELKDKIEGFLHDEGIVDKDGVPDEKKAKANIDKWLKGEGLDNEEDVQKKVDEFMDAHCFNDAPCLKKRLQNSLKSTGVVNDKGEGDPEAIEAHVKKFLEDKGLTDEKKIKKNVEGWIKGNCFQDEKCMEERIHKAVDDAPEKVTNAVTGFLKNMGLEDKSDANIPRWSGGKLSLTLSAAAAVAVSGVAISIILAIRRRQFHVQGAHVHLDDAEMPSADAETPIVSVD